MSVNRSSVCSRLCRGSAAAVAVAVAVALAGCTSRAINVTSTPPGAEVSINRRVVGHTPVRVNYTHYGTYRMEVRKERYEPQVRVERLNPPYTYGYDPLAFFADNLIPARIHDESYFHYVLQPVSKEVDRDGLMNRAAQAREGKATHPFTHETIEVAMKPVEAKVVATDLGAPAAAAAGPEARVIEGPAPAAKLELTAPAGITEKPPEAGPPATPAAPPATSAAPKAAPVPAGEKPPAEAAAPPKRMRRTPKGEILIYEEAPAETPDAGKK